MIKYFKFFIPSLTVVLAMYICTIGSYYSMLFFISFTLFIILGDIFLTEDVALKKYTYPGVLKISLYICLPILFIFISIVVFAFSNYSSPWFLDIFNNYLFINLLQFKSSITLIDKISLIVLTGFFIAIMAIGPGHELTHNKKNKFDMLIGNWLLAFSCNCAFAIEHVYGHHKNIGLPHDAVTAKRGDNIYTFILQAIIKEQTNAWKIELNQLKRRGFNPLGFKNKVIAGYLRSLTIVISIYMLGGLTSFFVYLLCILIGQSLLEVANYSQHYGLVREPGKPILAKHSWNSNDVMSGIFTFNVTKQSAHHEKPDAKFWELESYPDAPMVPYGYITMIYLSLFAPSLYHKIMAKKLIDWDTNYANYQEKKIAMIQNRNSGIPILINSNN